MKTFDIYFSDLNEKAKKSFLEFMGIEDPKEANMDIDVIPIATIDMDELSAMKNMED